MFSFSFDDAVGILRVEVDGSWTMPEVARYGREAGPQFREARHRAGSLRLLVDLRRTQILNQEVIRPLGEAGMQFARADDRVALLVSSSLLKLQMKRMVGDAPANIFMVEDAAVAWLAGTGPDEAAGEECETPALHAAG